MATASGTSVDGKGSLCYSLKDHRPPNGQEELLARCGVPTSRLNVSEGKALASLHIAKGVPYIMYVHASVAK